MNDVRRNRSRWITPAVFIRIDPSSLALISSDKLENTIARTDMKAIDLITGIPHFKYEVIRPIMAIGGSKANEGAAFVYQLLSAIGLKTGAPQGDPREAFEAAVSMLQSTCRELGGDAVIGVQFQHRIAMSKSLMSSSFQAPEIWAYGTVVRYLER